MLIEQTVFILTSIKYLNMMKMRALRNVHNVLKVIHARPTFPNFSPASYTYDILIVIDKGKRFKQVQIKFVQSREWRNV